MPSVRSRSQLRSVAGSVAASVNIQNAFQTAKATTIVIPAVGSPKDAVHIVPEYLVVKVSSIGSATKLTVAIGTSSDGDELVFPDTEATIALGKTTTTEGIASYAIQLPFVDTSGSDVTLYVFYKADGGTTMDVDSATLYYTRESA